MRPPSGGEKERRGEAGGIEAEGMEMERRRRKRMAMMKAGLWYEAILVKEEEA